MLQWLAKDKNTNLISSILKHVNYNDYQWMTTVVSIY